MRITLPVKSQFTCRRGYTVLLLSIATVCLGVYVGGLAAERGLQRRLAAYRQAGEPTSVPELVAYMQLDMGGVNARGSLLAAGLSYQASKEAVAERVQKPLFPFADHGSAEPGLWTAEEIGQVKLYLAERADFLKAVREASRFKSCFAGDYSRYSSYADIRRPLVAVVLEGTHHLCLSALVNLEEGRVDQAVEDLLSAQRLSRFLCSEPFLFNTVSAMQGDLLILRTIREVRVRNLLSAGQLRRLQQWRPIDEAVLQKGICLERLAGLDFYYAMRSGLTGQDIGGLAYLRLFPRMVSCAKLHRFLDMVDATRAVFDLPAGERFSAAQAVERRLGGVDPLASPLLVMAPPAGPLVRFYHHYRQEAQSLAEGEGSEQLLGDRVGEEKSLASRMQGSLFTDK